MKRRRKRLDWNPDLHDDDPMEVGRYQNRIAAAAGLYGLFKKSIDAEDAYAQHCPKCDRHTLVRIRPGDKKSPWKCNSCGNDSDEIGNRL